MKARPRSVERNVAKYLSNIFFDVGKSPVERVPTTGRTGPDVTINEIGLVIDVKSRKSIPSHMFAPESTILDYGEFCGFRLEDMLLCLKNTRDFSSIIWAPFPRKKMANVVLKWWNHMDEWTQKFHPGITTIILHRSRMPIGHSTVIIKSEDRSKLCQMLRSN